jgi:ribosomal protein S5
MVETLQGLRQDVKREASETRRLLHAVLRRETINMATIQDILAKVTAEKTLVESVAAFIEGLRGQPGVDSATVDAILAKMDENEMALNNAIAAGVTLPPGP